MHTSELGSGGQHSSSQLNMSTSSFSLEQRIRANRERQRETFRRQQQLLAEINASMTADDVPPSQHAALQFDHQAAVAASQSRRETQEQEQRGRAQVVATSNLVQQVRLSLLDCRAVFQLLAYVMGTRACVCVCVWMCCVCFVRPSRRVRSLLLYLAFTLTLTCPPCLCFVLVFAAAGCVCGSSDGRHPGTDDGNSAGCVARHSRIFPRHTCVGHLPLDDSITRDPCDEQCSCPCRDFCLLTPHTQCCACDGSRTQHFRGS